MPLSIPSVEDAVYMRLREEIARLELAPDQRLRLEHLAERYGVSLTPIRHTLRRLESEGLVVSEARRGAHVAPLNIEELEEIQALRVGLECFLARHGAERCTDEAIEEMVERRKDITRAAKHNDLKLYTENFWAFRNVCYRCAGRPRLIAALDDQRLRIERYVLYLSPDVRAIAGVRETPDDLINACRSRDGEAAERATRAGILWALDRFRAMLADAPAEARRASM